ncbi:MAG: lipocalin-like domain-containing protein [Gammaproteobacteria bacterium]
MKAPVSTLLMALLSSASLAQDDYQILRGEADGYAQVIPGKILEFPRDHAPHPNFRIEWWYITANLQDDEGKQWGLQWTLFRNALNSQADTEGWDSNQLWMAHAAISAPEGHQFEQRFARGGIGQAGVNDIARDGYFTAWLDDWQWRSDGASLFPSQLKFSVGEQQVEMRLDSSADWVLHGDRGYSQKSVQGQASYYYSQPNIKISGTIRSGNKTVALSGSAWLDREWSSQPLAQNQQGWDWFALHLDDGSKLMLYRLREDDGEDWLSGSWINSDGEKIHLNKADIELIQTASREVKIDAKQTIVLPLEWTVKLPKSGRQWRLKALYDEQWMATRFAYWEGVILVEDDKGQAAGVGYMELTGYD